MSDRNLSTLSERKEFEDYIRSIGWSVYWICPNHSVVHCYDTDILRESLTTCDLEDDKGWCSETLIPISEKLRDTLVKELENIESKDLETPVYWICPKHGIVYKDNIFDSGYHGSICNVDLCHDTAISIIKELQESLIEKLKGINI